MAQLMGGGFNAALVKPEQGSGSLPLGKHPVVVTASDVKPTKSNDGFFVELALEIIDGDYKGTTGAYRFNLYNNSDAARKIAEAQFSAVCHVIGQLDPFDDTQALHGRPFIIEVGNQKLTVDQEREKSEGKAVTPFTEVKKVYDINGNPPGHSGGGQAPQQQQMQQQQQAPANNTWGGGNAQQQQQAPQQQQQAPAQNQWSQQQQAPAQQQQQQQPQQPQQGNGTAWGTNNNQQAAKPAWGK